MESTQTSSAPTRRPGGRTAQVSRRVHDAVLDLLVESGTNGCTFKQVAEQAGVERSTLYRRYADRWEMIIDAFMEFAARDVMPDLQGSFAKDLKSVLTKLSSNLQSPLGPALMATAAELRNASEKGAPRAFFHQRMNQLDPMFDAAVERGELATEVDREELFTFAAGPIYFRIFIAAREVGAGFIDAIVESVCRLYGCRS